MTAPALDAPPLLLDLPTAAVPPQRWSGLLLPTNTPAGDGRVMLHDDSAVVPQRRLPLPLLAQPVLGKDHDGAIRVGMIRRLWMEADGVHGEGTFNPDADGQEWAERVARGEGWVSIDLSDVVVEKVPVGSDGTEAADLSAQTREQLSGWKVMGATLVSHPAFEDAFVDSWALAAGAGAACARVRYELPGWSVEAAPQAQATPTWTSLTAAGLAFPAADFADPQLDGPTALTIDSDGRVYGHLATWGTCHIGYSGVCVTAPPSRSGYAYFRQGLVNTREGGQVPVGKITMGTGHASTASGVGAMDAAAHYDDTGSVVALVAAGEDPHGIWLAGHLLPGAGEAQADTLRHSGVSGDWREIAGDMELVAALAVNVPGFPVPRTIAASGVLVAAGVVTPAAAANARAAADVDEVAAMRSLVAAAAVQPMRERVNRAAVESMRALVAAAAVNSDRNLVNYWTAGKGLARWAGSPHPWTTLVRELRKEIPATSMTDGQIQGLASNYFHRVHGYWPGDRKGSNPVGHGALAAAASQPPVDEEQANGQRIVRTPEGADRYGVDVGQPIPQGGKSGQQATQPAQSMDAEVNSVWEKIKRENPAEEKTSGGKSGSSKSTKEKDTTTKGEVPSGSKKLGSSTSARKSGDSNFMEEDEVPDTGAKGGKLTKFEAGVAYYDDGTLSDGKSWYVAGEPKAKTNTGTTTRKATNTSTTKQAGGNDAIANLIQSILALFTGKPSTGPSSGGTAATPPPADVPQAERIQRTRALMGELEKLLAEEEQRQNAATTTNGKKG